MTESTESTESPAPVTVTNCSECPFYLKASEARSVLGAPYFGVCGITGRFITTTAAAKLPGSDWCPRSARDGKVSIVPESAEFCAERKLRTPARKPFLIRHSEITPKVLREIHTATYATKPYRAPDSCKRCVFFQSKDNGIPGTPTGRYDSCQATGNLIQPSTRAATAELCTVPERATGRPVQVGGHSRPLLPIYVSDTAKVTDFGAREPGWVAPIDIRKAATPYTAAKPITAWASEDADPVADMRKAMSAIGGASLSAAHAAALADAIKDIEAKRKGAVTEVAATLDTADAAAKITEDMLRAASDAALVDTDTFRDAMERAVAEAEAAEKLAAVASVMTAEPEENAEETELDALTAAEAKGLKAMPTRVNRTGLLFFAEEYNMPYTLPEGAYGVVSVRSTSKASNFIFLPYFADKGGNVHHSTYERDIPAADDNAYFDHNDLLYRMAVAYMTDSVCALWGDAGVGKTEAVEHLARLTRQPFARISIKWATQVDDLIGRWTLRDGSMEWIDGRFTRAWRQPYIMCIDEPNTGKDEVWQALRAPFDGARELTLDEKDGERIPRNPLARVYTAMNPSWDARFAGTRPLNDADLDRMQHIMVPYADRDVEEKIIKAKAPAAITADAAQMTAILNVARDVRAAVKAKTIRISFGMRKVLRWCEAMQYMTPLQAFDQAVTAWMEPNEARALRDIADAYFKS